MASETESDDMPEEHERISEIREQRAAGGGALFGDPSPIKTSPTTAVQNPRPGPETKHPDIILVCTECRDYFEFDGDWEHCPKCGEGLAEVDKA